MQQNLAILLSQYRTLVPSSPTEHDRTVLTRAESVLGSALGLANMQMEQALTSRSYGDANNFLERAKLLSTALPSSPVNSAEDRAGESAYECVVSGLLLRKDRFDGNSSAFLGRGASAAVSRGLFVEAVGTSSEIRTTVAVKEVMKTGEASEQRAMRVS